MNTISKTSTPTQISNIEPFEMLTEAAAGATPPPANGGIIERIKNAFNHAIESIQSTSHNAIEKIRSSTNYVIDKITSLAGRVKDLTYSLVFDWNFEVTKTKIDQIVLTSFAVHTALCARILSGSGIPTTFLQWAASTPFLTLSAAALWYAGNLIDYDCPEKLEKIRKNATHLPITDLVNQHGWKNLFVYQILTPAEFQDAFRNFANTRSFKELFAFTKEATMELALASATSAGQKYQIPPLVEWVETFHHETASLELADILAEYALTDLQALNVLPPQELQLFEKAQGLLNELNAEKEIVRKKLCDFIGQAEKTVFKIDAAFGPNGSIEEELQILGDAFNKMRSETIQNHQKRLAEIGVEISDLTICYIKSKSSRPSIA